MKKFIISLLIILFEFVIILLQIGNNSEATMPTFSLGVNMLENGKTVAQPGFILTEITRRWRNIKNREKI